MPASGTVAPEPSALIDQHREQIDRIDKTIVALLCERMRVGRALGAVKRGLARPIRCDVREADVIRAVRGAASGSLSPESAERIFAAIIRETTAAQELE